MLKPENNAGGQSHTHSGKRVSCDGGGGALGHPKIWLTFGEDGTVTCPYCSNDFASHVSSNSASHTT
jgi:uncharacterized Zn-finger protein